MELIELFKGYSLEVVLISLVALCLTELVKLPIKKATSKLEEAKRKMVNIVIMLIPLVISAVASALYYGIRFKSFFSLTVLSCTFSSYVLSLSMYAIFSRIWLVIKGIMSGKETYKSELSNEAIEYFKGKIKELLKENKLSEKQVGDIEKSLEKLESLEKLLASDPVSKNDEQLNKVTSEISALMSEKNSKETLIASNKDKIEKYNAELYK